MLLAKFEDGFPVPVLDDAPELTDRIAWAYTSFKDLRTCRPVGMGGQGPIPVTSMMEFFDKAGYNRALWHEAKRYWSELDVVELDFYSKKHAAMMPKIPEAPKS